MLVLSRKVNEAIVIGGNIRVTMTAIRCRQVRVAIEAPPDVPIFREELLSETPGPAASRDDRPASAPAAGQGRSPRPCDPRASR